MSLVIFFGQYPSSTIFGQNPNPNHQKSTQIQTLSTKNQHKINPKAFEGLGDMVVATYRNAMAFRIEGRRRQIRPQTYNSGHHNLPHFPTISFWVYVCNSIPPPFYSPLHPKQTHPLPRSPIMRNIDLQLQHILIHCSSSPLQNQTKNQCLPPFSDSLHPKQSFIPLILPINPRLERHVLREKQGDKRNCGS